MRKIVAYTIALTLLSVYFLSADVLRILPVMNFCHQRTSRDAFVGIMMPLLEKHGIEFVTENPDLVMICGRMKKQFYQQFSQCPIVILDEQDSASLDKVTRNCLKRRNVRAVFKNTILRPKERYNDFIVLNAYHFKLINDSCKKLDLRQPVYLAKKELQKIQCFLWDINRSHLRADLETIKNESLDFDQNRSVDVSFSGIVDYGSQSLELPSFHRQQALNQLRQIQGYNIVAYEGRLPMNEYFALLKNSKIVVSPWGNGEWCWRDYEAIYSGAVLIKPDTSFVQSVPDLYQNDRYYVSCKPDFSDLEEKIIFVLKNYSRFMGMRKNARKLLVDDWDYEERAKRLAERLKSIVL